MVPGALALPHPEHGAWAGQGTTFTEPSLEGLLPFLPSPIIALPVLRLTELTKHLSVDTHVSDPANDRSLW